MDEKTKAKLARKKQKMVFMGRGIEVVQSDIPDLEVGYRPEPEERWHERLRHGRTVINYGTYLRKGHPSPERVAEGLYKRLPPKAQKRVSSRLGKWLLGRRLTLRAWRWVEALSRPSPTVLRVLEEIKPDVLVVSPTVWPKNPVEADYIRAAKSLGIRTVGYLNSWDNLTSKGTVHVVPDAYIVWNEALAGEAVGIHCLPKKVIKVTGAPHLDRFFDMGPPPPLAEIRDKMVCPGDGPYVVYLCTSRTLIASEVHIVEALASALEQRFASNPPVLVVRPHPVNPDPWAEYEREGVSIYPTLGDQADCPEAWEEYYAQLAAASCVVGLNTTAFLEAAVADVPCLTIVDDEYHEQQGKTGHFRHLLAADFLEVSENPGEVADRIARILDGVDEKAAGRRAFVEWFLRPGGLDRASTPIVVDTITELPGRRLRRVASKEADSSLTTPVASRR
jgi:hypothetical protein